MRKRPIIISLFVISVVTTAAFLPSLDNGFVNWDDNRYVTENPRIKALSGESVKDIFTSAHQGLYKPLTELTFAVEYRFFGLNPRAFHAVNLFFHLLNTLLVFRLVLLLTERVGVSWIAALLFGVHPLHVESVAWISERKDVLYAFFFLGSLIAYLLYLRKGSIKYYCLSLFLFLLSFLPKPQGICLPFILFLCDYLKSRKFGRKALFEKAPFFLIAAIFAVITAIGLSSVSLLNPTTILTETPDPLNAPYGLVFYLGKLLLPVGLSCLYPDSERAVRLLQLSPLIAGALAVGAVYSGRRTKKIIFAGLFFLINLLPVLQVVPLGPAVVADRYSYIASIGYFYLLGWFFARLIGGRGRLSRFLSVSLLVVIVGLFSLLTFRRCRVWAGGESLWRDVLRKYPDSHLARNGLANALLMREEWEEAFFNYREALRAAPDYTTARINLGFVLAQRERFEEADRHFAVALRREPDNPRVLNLFGAALARQGRHRQALSYFDRALRYEPDYADALHNRGLAFLELGRSDEAVSSLTEAVRINPDLPGIWNDLGDASVGRGGFEEAFSCYREALRADPGDAKVHTNLGVLLAGQGRLEEAISHYHEAIRLEPDYAEAHNNLGNILARQGKYRAALARYNQALRIRPDFSEARRNRELTRAALERKK